MAGVAQALRDAAVTLEVRGRAVGRPLVASSGAFDGLAEAPPLGLAASICAAAAGAAVVTACGGRLGPKNGVTVADVLGALGGPQRPDTAASEGGTGTEDQATPTRAPLHGRARPDRMDP